MLLGIGSRTTIRGANEGSDPFHYSYGHTVSVDFTNFWTTNLHSFHLGRVAADPVRQRIRDFLRPTHPSRTERLLAPNRQSRQCLRHSRQGLPTPSDRHTYRPAGLRGQRYYQRRLSSRSTASTTATDSDL